MGDGMKGRSGADLDRNQHYLRFLSAAGANKVAMPDVFTRDSEENCVMVSGDLDFDAPDEIRFI